MPCGITAVAFASMSAVSTHPHYASLVDPLFAFGGKRVATVIFVFRTRKYYLTVKVIILLFLLPGKGSVRKEKSRLKVPLVCGAVKLKVKCVLSPGFRLTWLKLLSICWLLITSNPLKKQASKTTLWVQPLSLKLMGCA